MYKYLAIHIFTQIFNYVLASCVYFRNILYLCVHIYTQYIAHLVKVPSDFCNCHVSLLLFYLRSDFGGYVFSRVLQNLFLIVFVF